MTERPICCDMTYLLWYEYLYIKNLGNVPSIIVLKDIFMIINDIISININ